MIRKGIRITPKTGGVQFTTHNVDGFDMIKGLQAIADCLACDYGMDKDAILKAAEACADGSAFKARLKK